MKALFDPSMKWQLVEEYGVDSFTEQDDGSLLFEHEYADDEGLLSWMLSCGDKVTVLDSEGTHLQATLLRNPWYITMVGVSEYEEIYNEKEGVFI